MRAVLATAIFAALVALSCRHESALQVRYLPGLVAGTHNVLPPATIAVFPAIGAQAAGKYTIGAVYNPDGSVMTSLAIRDVGALVTKGVARCLSDAGLKVSIADSGTPGSAFTLATDIESISVDKHFAAQQTIHGQYFTMTSEVKLRFTLSSSGHPTLYTVVTTGNETEPPAPVGGEDFLPLETEPAESLSVAMSRAIGALVLQPQFRQALAN